MGETVYAQLKKWPYPVNYGKENEISADVLIIGGGIAGCHAAISAVKRGAKVAVAEKATVLRGGSGGDGVDHWHLACTNPCSGITPTEMMEYCKSTFGDRGYGEFGNGITAFISASESYDALLDIEKMGVKVRDVDDLFVGAPFRDEKTKLMFAYDYDNKFTIRVQAANVKPALQKEMKRLGVKIYDRIIITKLLTEEGKPGNRVIGAMGVNVHTGEFYIFKAKATIFSAAKPDGIWMFSSELKGAAAYQFDPNATPESFAAVWDAGAELGMMESSSTRMQSGGYSYLMYTTGNSSNTWFACTLVDADGKEIPWVDRDGKILKSVEERNHPAPGQRAFVYDGPRIISDLPERIARGEFKLPLYADLPGMPEHERRAIWGLMIGNEGKTRIPVYWTLQNWGFDPDKDMLQTNVMPPDQYTFRAWWMGYGPRQHRVFGGGVAFDWDLKTNLEGLYAAGSTLLCGADHACSAATGRYAARKAAKYAATAREPAISRKQVEAEKVRVYAPVNRKDGIGWKELKMGLVRIMQDYCGEFKNEEVLQRGLEWLKSMRESELASAYARNPHELGHVLEAMAQATVDEVIIEATRAHKASSLHLDLKRLDYPRIDPPEYQNYMIIRQDKGRIKTGSLPLGYWLLPPYAPTYEENYRKHGELEK